RGPFVRAVDPREFDLGEVEVEAPAAERAADAPDPRADVHRSGRRGSARDVHGGRLEFAVVQREAAGDLDAGYEREALEYGRARREPGIAAAQAAEARSARQFLLGLQRRADDLTVEVDERVEHRDECLARPAAELAGRTHRSESGRRDGRGRERVAGGR